MTVSREENVWVELKKILSTDADLSYIKKVYEGWRETIPQEVFPCVYIEPASTTEEPYAVPMRHRLLFDVRIIGEINVIDYDKQIIGNDKIKGIIDIANDIKSTIWKYPNLNGVCQKFNFPTTNYIFENFPFRRVEITMRIELITIGSQR